MYYRVGVVLVLVHLCCGYYLPGIAPNDFEEGRRLEVFAENLRSAEEEVPFDYYSLKFCEPDEMYRAKHLNLGEIFMGERNEITSYEVFMLAAEECKVQCTVYLTAKDTKMMMKRIKDKYKFKLTVDNMPMVMPYSVRGEESYVLGVPIGGENEDGSVFIFNHLNLKVLYHQPKFSSTDLNIGSSGQFFRVVGFEGMPASRKYEKTENVTCPLDLMTDPMILNMDVREITFTYSVSFEESDVEWATRWDPLLKPQEEAQNIQWISIINSLVAASVLSLIVGSILFRTVYLDFSRYNSLPDEDEIADDSGWKQVRGDVFRPPQQAALFSILVGSGAQVLVIASTTLLFCILGFLSPASRGSLLTALLCIWVLSSFVAGYASAKLYANLNGINRRIVSLGSCLLFSGVIFTVFLSLNFVLWLSGSSAAVSFITLVLLVPLWVIVSIPLCFLGASIGYTRKLIEFPCPVSTLARPVPEEAQRPPAFVYIMAAGFVPFSAILIELMFVLSSLWQDQIFYMFGLLYIAYLILLLMCCEVSLVVVYLRLTKGDHRWWWTSFLAPAATGFYTFACSIFYLVSQPSLRGMHFTSFILYIGYMFVMSLGVWLLTGAVGLYSSFWFVKKMYSSIHVE